MTEKHSDKLAQPQVREDLIFPPLDEEWVVYDSDGEKLHVLNSSAAVVWMLCDGQHSVGEIVDDVLEAFDGQVAQEQAETDVRDAIEEFETKGLLK